MRISDWSSDVCSSDLQRAEAADAGQHFGAHGALGKWLDVFDQRIAGFDIDPRIAVADRGFGGIGRVQVEFSLSRGYITGFKKDRKSVVEGKSVSVRVDFGGGRIIKKKNTNSKR